MVLTRNDSDEIDQIQKFSPSNIWNERPRTVMIFPRYWSIKVEIGNFSFSKKICTGLVDGDMNASVQDNWNTYGDNPQTRELLGKENKRCRQISISSSEVNLFDSYKARHYIWCKLVHAEPNRRLYKSCL